ncbi:DedA family protein/thiosulfate sulfurtransferase GlpE [Methylotenera sp.]|uniref:DedA family protein/thiosulfate sulfurtransferase GlpE n=1 Tax=Methylotenera sp. TaxID=2051956 RepID=UPI002489155F|nr:DedA family protein/thiosulfate sulfurtransferase GlpE [Methylotenera sp.]MDI1360911.1 DedA family protein/thiosulfate sulfurtransferase GlpE [Methylotenera sp.]
MSYIAELIQQFGLIIVFVNVFLEQLGVPIPAYPTLVIAGALISPEQFSLPVLLLTAVVGAVIADTFWYFAGRKYGNRVLSKLCKISLSPDACVAQSQSLFLKFGSPALLICKFIPGFASISSALAGSTGTKLIVFLIMDALGAALWAGSALWLGSLFSNAIDELMNVLIEMGKWGMLLVLFALFAFIASKWWERQRFLKDLRMARISVEELNTLLTNGETPIILDTRAPHLVKDGWIPGAQFITMETLDRLTLKTDDNEAVILYCSCPNEVTAAKIAKALMTRGHYNVRPLAGGIDAWRAAGHSIENLK